MSHAPRQASSSAATPVIEATRVAMRGVCGAPSATKVSARAAPAGPLRQVHHSVSATQHDESPMATDQGCLSRSSPRTPASVHSTSVVMIGVPHSGHRSQAATPFRS